MVMMLINKIKLIETTMKRSFCQATIKNDQTRPPEMYVFIGNSYNYKIVFSV